MFPKRTDFLSGNAYAKECASFFYKLLENKYKGHVSVSESYLAEKYVSIDISVKYLSAVISPSVFYLSIKKTDKTLKAGGHIHMVFDSPENLYKTFIALLEHEGVLQHFFLFIAAFGLKSDFIGKAKNPFDTNI